MTDLTLRDVAGSDVTLYDQTVTAPSTAVDLYLFDVDPAPTRLPGLVITLRDVSSDITLYDVEQPGLSGITVYIREPGQTQTLSYRLTAAKGTYTLSGVAADVLAARLMPADTGAYAFLGADADFSKTGSAEQIVVGGGGRTRRRITWLDYPDLDLEDEEEAREVLRTVKREVKRALPRSVPAAIHMPALPRITIRGAEPSQAVRMQMARTQADLAAAYARMLRELDEDDIEVLLL